MLISTRPVKRLIAEGLATVMTASLLIATTSVTPASASGWADNSWDATESPSLSAIVSGPGYGRYKTTSTFTATFDGVDAPAISDLEFDAGSGDALDTFGFVNIWPSPEGDIPVESIPFIPRSASDVGGVMTFIGIAGEDYVDVKVTITLVNQKVSWRVETYEVGTLNTTPVVQNVGKIEILGNLGSDSGTTVVPDASGNRLLIHDGNFDEVLTYWNPGSGTFTNDGDDVFFTSSTEVSSYEMSVLAFNQSNCNSPGEDAISSARAQILATPNRTATDQIVANVCPASVGDDVVINGGGGALADGTDGIKIILNSNESTDYNGDLESQDPNNGSDQIFLNGLSNVCCGGIGPSLNIGGELFGVNGAANGATEWRDVYLSDLNGSANFDYNPSDIPGDGGVKITYVAERNNMRYELIRTISYTYPNKYFQDSYEVVVPSGNTERVRFYMGGDTAPGGDDNGFGIVLDKLLPLIPGKTLMSLNPYPESAMFIAYRETGTDYFDGFWSQSYSDDYPVVEAGGNIGTSLADNLETDVHDAGIMMQWNLPGGDNTTPGRYTRTVETMVDRYSGMNVQFGFGTTAASFEPLEEGNIVSTLPANAAIQIKLFTSQRADQTSQAFSLNLPAGVTATGPGTDTCTGSAALASAGSVVNGSGITIPAATSVAGECLFTVPVAIAEIGTYELIPTSATTDFPLISLVKTSVEVAVPSAPSAPQNLDYSPDPGNRSIIVDFDAPSDDGGSEITNYEYSIDGGVTWVAVSPASTNLSITIPSLTIGTTYPISVRAVNAVGPSIGADSLSADLVYPLNPNSDNCSSQETFNNEFVEFEDVCKGGGEVDDVGTVNTGDAYDGFGQIKGVNADDSTFTLGSNSFTETESGIEFVTSNIWSPSAGKFVDVVVERTFIGNTLTWQINVFETGTNIPSTLELFIDGNLGSDGDTAWTTSNGYTVSTDGPDGDTVIIWSTTGTISTSGGVLVDEEDDVRVDFGVTGSATLSHTFLGYQCVDQRSRIYDRIDEITASFTTGSSLLNTNIAEVGECIPDVPDAPRDVITTPGNGTVLVEFAAPNYDGGADITNYEYSIDGGVTWVAVSPASTDTSITISGLTNGTIYPVSVRAVNSVGASLGTDANSVKAGFWGIPGIKVKETVNELPAPDVAMASDGRSLIVWQDAGEGNTGCNDQGIVNEGDICNILGAIVSADGTTTGTPFLLSGSVAVDYYFAAPYVIWNADRNEWLVMMTSETSGSQGVYAQRVASSGALVGDLVTLPSFKATTATDRSTVVDLQADRDRVQATATWSSADQVYLVTWMAEGDNTSVGMANGRSVYGYFMNGQLASADGVNAAFALSNNPTRSAWSGLVKQEYSVGLDKWASIWSASSSNRQMRMTVLDYTQGSFTVSESSVVADASEFGYDDFQMAGDILWVPSLNSWIVSWNGSFDDASGNRTFNSYARTISSSGALGDPVKVTDFQSGIPLDRSVIWMNSHQLVLDTKTNTIHAAGHMEIETNFCYSSCRTTVAAMWSFGTDLSPISWDALIAPRTSMVDDAEVTSFDSSSRPRITVINGGIGVVYQNWPQGQYDDPAEVRYHLVAGATPPAAAPAAVINPTPIVEATDLALKLTLALDSRLTSGASVLSGSGLKANSEYQLIIQSNPVLLYRGTSDASGNFISNYNFNDIVCPAAGIHTLSLVGIKPDGTQTKAIAKIMLDGGCKVKAIAQGGMIKTLTYAPFLFGHQSSKLTKKAKNSLKSLVPLLAGAKVVQVYGYTEMNSKSKANIKANKALAKKRATVVRKYLRARGVDASIQIIAKGGVDPVSKKKQRLNRRVEMMIGYTL